MPTECQILTNEAEVEKLADEWRQLHANCGLSPYTDYDFFHIWWTTVGKSSKRKLQIVIGRDGGRLVGILPLFVESNKGMKIMRGAGHKVYHYADVLCENEAQAKDLWQVARRSPHYHFAAIRDVYGETKSHKVLSSMGKRRDLLAAFYLHNQWQNGEEWLASLPGRTRRDHVRYMRKLEDKAPVQFEICQSEPVPNAVIEEMLRHKIKWAHERHKQGLFEHPAVGDFFYQLLQQMAHQNRLFLTWLKCGDNVVAYFLWFKFNNALWGFAITYDFSWAPYSPGNVLLAHSLMRAVDNGLTDVYIGNGELKGGGSYKAKFSNEIGECIEYSFSGSLVGWFLETAFYGLRDGSRILKKITQRLKRIGRT